LDLRKKRQAYRFVSRAARLSMKLRSLPRRSVAHAKVSALLQETELKKV
jgi:hypothetical protein